MATPTKLRTGILQIYRNSRTAPASRHPPEIALRRHLTYAAWSNGKESNMRPSGRDLNQMREVTIETGILTHADGSCLICVGDTRVICSASLGERVPMFRRNTGLGWITCEYAMLPGSTHSRNRRERTIGHPSGRSQEIQRLVGRSLRSCVEFASMGERQIIIDCDVINADGSTRCAAVTGGWVALRIAMDRLMEGRKIASDPLVNQVAAVSCGAYAGQTLLDLDYAEDSEAETDANFVMNDDGNWIEVQCTAEGMPFTGARLTEFLSLAEFGITQLFALQRSAVGRLMPVA